MLLVFFLNYSLIPFLIPTVITEIFNPVAELVIPVEIPTKEAKAASLNICSSSLPQLLQILNKRK